MLLVYLNPTIKNNWFLWYNGIKHIFFHWPELINKHMCAILSQTPSNMSSYKESRILIIQHLYNIIKNRHHFESRSQNLLTRVRCCLEQNHTMFPDILGGTDCKDDKGAFHHTVFRDFFSVITWLLHLQMGQILKIC